MIENISNSLIDWSRAQFALTAMYHWIFVPLTLGLGIIQAMMETLYYKTGTEFGKQPAQFGMKLFGINFAIGVFHPHIFEAGKRRERVVVVDQTMIFDCSLTSLNFHHASDVKRAGTRWLHIDKRAVEQRECI